ncbi:unnamed protein product [Rotaria magnacalcarata]|uniref:Uncharacterized protein n=1 Tax=Rotaria magnacalcarata TaxID=392030 RepID=A0A819WA46_9BILA|nr:unnamed protein product [Rotaria magnacalcarata]
MAYISSNTLFNNKYRRRTIGSAWVNIIKRLVQQQASIQFYIRLSFILSRCRRRTIDSRISKVGPAIHPTVSIS